MSNQLFQSESFYKDLSGAIHALSGMILFNFAQHDCTKKDVILRNFVARSATSLKSIMALWDLDDHPSAWVINRTMLDRLFHLNDLGKNETHELFDDWSFYRQYKDQNRLKSDIEFKDKATGSEYDLSPEQKERFKELSNNIPSWKRPNAEAVAKGMDMTFLYKYGYDYASKFVHPMSDDGLHDFYLITKLEPALKQPSHISVLSNSVLASTMIIQEAINQSSFKWRRIVFDCIDQIRSAIETGNESYIQTMIKIIHMYKEISLNEVVTA